MGPAVRDAHASHGLRVAGCDRIHPAVQAALGGPDAVRPSRGHPGEAARLGHALDLRDDAGEDDLAPLAGRSAAPRRPHIERIVWRKPVPAPKRARNASPDRIRFQVLCSFVGGRGNSRLPIAASPAWSGMRQIASALWTLWNLGSNFE